MEHQNLTFEEWVAYVFDHEVKKPEWYWDMERNWWDELKYPGVTINYMTQFFQNANVLCTPYTDEQVNQGLWFMVYNACSNHMFALNEQAVPMEARLNCIQSIYDVYEKVFFKRCSPHLSHVTEQEANPINLVCYMWWDLMPIYGQPQKKGRQPIDEACLQVMEKTLTLDSVACQEGALHGLGHWQTHYPERIASIVDAFITSHPDLCPELHDYALSAGQGHVL